MAANLSCLVVVVRYQNIFGRKFRVLGSFVAWFVVFAAVTCMVLIVDIDQDLLYWATMVACVLCGVFSAVCSGGVFGMVAQFPAMYIQAVMSGQGLSGVTAAVVGLGAAFASEAASEDDDCDDKADDEVFKDDNFQDDDGTSDCTDYTAVDYGSFTYFLVACLIFFLCIAAYIILDQSPFARFYDSGQGGSSSSGSGDGQSVSGVSLPPGESGRVPSRAGIATTEADSAAYAPLGGVDGEEDRDDPNGGARGYAAQVAKIKAGEGRGGGGGGSGGSGGSSAAENAAATGPPELADYQRVFWLVRWEAFAVWFVFTVTISLFPAVSARIRPLAQRTCGGGGIFTDATFTATLFVIFNALDLVGRTGAGFVQAVPKDWLPFASVSRLVFVPLFAFCNVSETRLHVVFHGAIWPLTFMACMALTNGYLSTLAMIYGPSRVTASSDAELAGSVMILALTTGLFTGSMFSYLVSYAVMGSF